ncbi:MAG TPA: glycosyltransferase family 39 protein [Chthoniobacterales bacterium]|nr:glycosyltransferase family 39 protein [Chthoniobacterales bacterium]
MERAIHLTRASPPAAHGFFSGPAIVWSLAMVKLLFHLLTAGRYGIFRDELYYLACSEHLDFGYVDQPPLIALITWIARHLFGESLIGLRLVPALAGAATVWLSGKLAREMGGRVFAQGLAALAVIAAPIFLLMHHWMTMNAFEPLIWLGCAWCIVRAINQGDPRSWLWFGLLIGLGMENKYSTAFFALAVFVSLFLTPQRRFLSNAWIWIGALCSLLIFLPNLIWLVRHDFPFLELMHNIRGSGRDVVRGPVAFIADQAMLMNPVLFPLWLGGLFWLFLNRNGSRYRILAWTYALMLVAFIALKGKNYYLAAAYPMLLAGGAVALENITRERGRWSRGVYVGLIVTATCLIAPTVAPILPVEIYVRYQKAIGLEPPKAENQPTGPLPQHFADEFGWEEMALEVARVYHDLPPEQRAATAIFANSYGQAGAIDFFGKKYGLPKAISNHQSYWLWGPRGFTGGSVIVLGSDGSGDREHFASVEAVGRTYHPYSRRDEHFEVFLCRDLNTTLPALWPKTKKWD